MDSFLYVIKDSLYINLTNRCPCNCIFCVRQVKDQVHGSDSLWLSREPSVVEVKEGLKQYDLANYKEIVFCGYGEPTERLYELLELAKYIKNELGKPVRVNTNGLSDLIHGRSTAGLFQGVVDAVSISLNAPNQERYYELTRNGFGVEAYRWLIRFVEEIIQFVPEVVLTTIDTVLTTEEEKQCERLCKDLKVTYRIRKYES